MYNFSVFLEISTVFSRDSLVAQMAKNLSAMLETWVRSLGQEESLEKEMATHCSILAWRIPWTEELWQATVHGAAKIQASHTHTHTHTHTSDVQRLC